MNKTYYKPPIFWEQGKNYLVQKDKKLGRLIKSYPKDFLFTKFSQNINKKNNYQDYRYNDTYLYK